ncbi:hypothetical protein SJ05684_b55120 (plasmid) [Sinorhizobium sojae CCBAU 05684]|uniref:Uncharacterized protein n=2 Tax=Sinorhizobium sojae TaxID=716925 RepID=A0A249PLC9_9HYPH|nr:hypothetical protein SJ05684_b55120 [Sinorhizobium sojae CCBAU 05684]
MRAPVTDDSGEVLVAESRQRSRGTAAPGDGKRHVEAPNAA